MKSPEKVLLMLELLQDSEDDEINEALPIGPPPMIRAGLVAVARYLPEQPDELDTFLTQVGDFCHALRSDDQGGTPLDAVPMPAGELETNGS
jgi:hypothetical protein